MLVRVGARVVAPERPEAAAHRVALVRHRARHVDAVRDAGAVGDHERRAGPGVGLEQRLERLRVVGAERDLRDVDVAVGAARSGPGPCAARDLPLAANFATAPRGVAFDACPPVFE